MNSTPLLCATICALAVALALPLSAQTLLTSAVPLHLPADKAAITLPELGDQTGLNVLFKTEDVEGCETPPIDGTLSLRTALDRLLARCRLEYAYANGTLTIKPIRKAPAPVVAGTGPDPVLVRDNLYSWTPSVGVIPFQLISSSADIEASGATSVGEYLDQESQFTGPTASDTVLRVVGRDGETNSGLGKGENLRGVGSGTTVTVVNGQRVPVSGTRGTFSDTSNIPLSAVEQVHVIPDGSSARYGADAVGGVVEFQMRRDFNGYETRALFGPSLGGALHERFITQLAGKSWDHLSALVSLEYYDRGALPTSDRWQANNDLTPYGGHNYGQLFGNPGTVFYGGQTYAIPYGQNGKSLTSRELTAATQNLFNQLEGSDILPHQQRLSVFANLRWTLGEGIEISASSLFGDRHVTAHSGGFSALVLVPQSNAFYVTSLGTASPLGVYYNFLRDLGSVTLRGHIQTGTLLLGTVLPIGSSWHMTVNVSYAYEKQHDDTDHVPNFGALTASLSDSHPSTAFDAFGDGSFTNPTTLGGIAARNTFISGSTSKEAQVFTTGELFHAPAGGALMTVGADYRSQALATTTQSGILDTVTSANGRRSVVALFDELCLPLLGSGTNLCSADLDSKSRALVVNIAARYEYSGDLGGGLAPQGRFVWSPLRWLYLHGSIARSIVRPSLEDLNESSNVSQLCPLRGTPPQPSITTALCWTGNNSDLRPATANSWAAGLTFAPGESLEVTLHYFDILLRRNVVEPSLPTSMAVDPTQSYLITPNPTPAQLARVCDHSAFEGAAPCAANTVGAIYDLRLNDLSSLRSTGIDLESRLSRATSTGRWGITLKGTRMLRYVQNQPLASVNLLDTPNYPPKLKFRGELSWQREGVAAMVAINHEAGYTNTLVQPSRNVGSWTTLDLHLIWRPNSELAQGVEFSLHVQNLLNTPPPFVDNPNGYGYDAINSNLLGRFFRLGVRKHFQ